MIYSDAVVMERPALFYPFQDSDSSLGVIATSATVNADTVYESFIQAAGSPKSLKLGSNGITYPVVSKRPWSGPLVFECIAFSQSGSQVVLFESINTYRVTETGSTSSAPVLRFTLEDGAVVVTLGGRKYVSERFSNNQSVHIVISLQSQLIEALVNGVKVLTAQYDEFELENFSISGFKTYAPSGVAYISHVAIYTSKIAIDTIARHQELRSNSASVVEAERYGDFIMFDTHSSGATDYLSLPFNGVWSGNKVNVTNDNGSLKVNNSIRLIPTGPGIVFYPGYVDVEDPIELVGLFESGLSQISIWLDVFIRSSASTESTIIFIGNEDSYLRAFVVNNTCYVEQKVKNVVSQSTSIAVGSYVSIKFELFNGLKVSVGTKSLQFNEEISIDQNSRILIGNGVNSNSPINGRIRNVKAFSNSLEVFHCSLNSVTGTLSKSFGYLELNIPATRPDTSIVWMPRNNSIEVSIDSVSTTFGSQVPDQAEKIAVKIVNLEGLENASISSLALVEPISDKAMTSAGTEVSLPSNAIRPLVNRQRFENVRSNCITLNSPLTIQSSATVNFLPDPTLYNSENWIPNNCSMSRVFDRSILSGYGILMAYNTASTPSFTSSKIAVLPLEQYDVAISGRAISQSANCTVSIAWFNSGNSLISSSTVSKTLTLNDSTIYGRFTSPSGSSYALITVAADSGNNEIVFSHAFFGRQYQGPVNLINARYQWIAMTYRNLSSQNKTILSHTSDRLYSIRDVDNTIVVDGFSALYVNGILTSSGSTIQDFGLTHIAARTPLHNAIDLSKGLSFGDSDIAIESLTLSNSSLFEQYSTMFGLNPILSPTPDSASLQVISDEVKTLSSSWTTVL